jgi:hypothetical protein
LITGFSSYCSGDHGAVLLSEEAAEFLEEEVQNDRQHVKQLDRILRRLCDFGQANLNKTEQFRKEDSFPSGVKGKPDIAVYAVKAHQLRLYGGFLTIGNTRAFVCVEGVRKRNNRADQEQLRRVARRLGELANANP